MELKEVVKQQKMIIDLNNETIENKDRMIRQLNEHLEKQEKQIAFLLTLITYQ